MPRDTDSTETIIHVQALRNLAYAAMEGVTHWQDAVPRLEAMVREDAELFAAIQDYLFTQACYGLIRNITNSMRRAGVYEKKSQSAESVDESFDENVTPPLRGPLYNPRKIEAVSQYRRALLLDGFWLPSGVRLRDATRDDLLGAINLYSSQANGLMRNVRFLTLIADNLTTDKVGDQFDEEKLLKFMTEAKGEK